MIQTKEYHWGVQITETTDDGIHAFTLYYNILEGDIWVYGITAIDTPAHWAFVR